MSKSVRGFHNDEVSRKLKQRQEIQGDVICVKGIEVEADMTFDSASIEYEEETHRPYIFFRDGHITSIKGNLPLDVTHCSFTKKNAPEIELKWDLSNEEIKKLVDKGIYGFDRTYKKMKSMFEIPSIFTEVLWNEIPVKADIMALETRLEDGTHVPIISVSIDKPYEQRMNSFDSGYENIATYFENPEFYDQTYGENKNHYFTLSDDEIIKSATKTEEVNKNDEHIVRTLEVLSPSEQQEKEIRGELHQQVRENIEAVQSQNQVEDIARMDENLEIEEIRTETPETKISEFEPYTKEELEELHIVGRKDEEHRAAEAKLAEIARKKQEEEAKKAVIEKTMAEAEEVDIREKCEDRSSSSYGTHSYVV